MYLYAWVCVCVSACVLECMHVCVCERERVSNSFSSSPKKPRSSWSGPMSEPNLLHWLKSLVRFRLKVSNQLKAIRSQAKLILVDL